MNVIAPAKLNLCLYLGPTHDDGMHQLVSIFEPLSLRDELTVSEAPADEVLCPAVPGENLAAGLGGGSADAAAVLRLAGGEVDDLAGIAATLGADVPSQIDPVTCLVEGVGQKLTTLPVAADHWIVLLPGGGGLSTAEVFAEADRIGIGRSQEELDEIAGRLWAVASNAVSPLAYPALLVNDLERPAISLRPEIGSAMQAMEEAGAGFVAMTGSGPTVFGIFADAQTAADAAASLGDEAILCQGGIGL